MKSGISKVYNTVIIGGGAVGSSVAVHLALAGAKNIAVVEKDPSYKYASSSLSASGIRQQFSLKENIDMSLYGTNFLQNPALLAVDGIAPDYQFFQNGYLFLATNEGGGADTLRRSRDEQHRCGATWIDLLDRGGLAERFPWLSLDGSEGGGEGSALCAGSNSLRNEGYFDPWGMLSGMRRKAISLGVQYIHGEAVGAALSGGDAGPCAIEAVHVQPAGGGEAGPLRLGAENFVNAAGPFAGALMETLRGGRRGIAALPVEARKRCVFVVDCQPPPGAGLLVPPRSSPLVVEPGGVWFRPEGQAPSCRQFIMGVSPRSEEDPAAHSEAALERMDCELFDERVWPAVAARVPAFEHIKMTGCWAGFYEYNTLDQVGDGDQFLCGLCLLPVPFILCP